MSDFTRTCCVMSLCVGICLACTAIRGPLRAAKIPSAPLVPAQLSAAPVHPIAPPHLARVAVSRANPTQTTPARAGINSARQQLSRPMLLETPSTVIGPIGTSTPALAASSDAAPGAFTTYQYQDTHGQSMIYYLYTPANFDPTHKYPLILVLHGGGERASWLANAAQNRATLLNQSYVQAFVAPTVQAKWPAFVLVPQLAPNQNWVDVPVGVSSYTLAATPSPSLMLSMEILTEVQQAYPAIDPHRIDIAGISLGAFGVWEALERWPAIFAAAIPIAGAGDLAAASNARAVAIWAFHGALDVTVPVDGSRLMVRAVQDAGGDICYTEFPNRGHDVWNSEAILSQRSVLVWLFAQSKISSTPIAAPGCPTFK